MSQPKIHVELFPAKERLSVEPGALLQDVLFEKGIEFPCGGHGQCEGCRVRLIDGELTVSEQEKELLTETEIDAGWRLACAHRVGNDLKLEIAQWEPSILSDSSPVQFQPQEGYGVAVDLGSTTLVAQLVHLKTGNVLAVETGLNIQAKRGADIMSRIHFALIDDGQTQLGNDIRRQVGSLIETLLRERDGIREEIKRVVIVGNTVMHHLFCGLDIAPLSAHPFDATSIDRVTLDPCRIGLQRVDDNCVVEFLPCLGSFVGSDILAGVLATQLHQSRALNILVDLGTNGEIVAGNRQRMLCASTAAGPAFEGAKISMGMRAATGAISEVYINSGDLVCKVLGNTAPRGICGSGLVDAVACGLTQSRIQPSGRMQQDLALGSTVSLTQCDIRELQLAKGAIAAGIRVLIRRLGAELDDVERVYIAGAFGNYINPMSAQRIGLLKFPVSKLFPLGNGALMGARKYLLNPDSRNTLLELPERITHVSLNEDEEFLDAFIEEMRFPTR
jgi:uncharacterized 2Fe-2S/4Fe-4S cluster protein (DUF4445 family)